jgi:hypothetical protein
VALRPPASDSECSAVADLLHGLQAVSLKPSVYQQQPACCDAQYAIMYLVCGGLSWLHLMRCLLYAVRSVGVNKGGVAIGLKVGSTHIAFVGSHLAAHQSKSQQRNKGQRSRITTHISFHFYATFIAVSTAHVQPPCIRASGTLRACAARSCVPTARSHLLTSVNKRTLPAYGHWNALCQPGRVRLNSKASFLYGCLRCVYCLQMCVRSVVSWT